MKDRYTDIKNKRVSQREFDRIMRAIKEQAREYPNKHSKIDLCLDWTERKYGVDDSASNKE